MHRVISVLFAVAFVLLIVMAIMPSVSYAQDECLFDDDGDEILNCEDGCPFEGDQGFGLIGGCPAAPPANTDSDGDGVADLVDSCPFDHGNGSFDGCPQFDSDGDEIFDSEDGCPFEGDQGFGLIGGCPAAPPANTDSDGDGVADLVDSCPFQHGNGSFDGCPSSSNTGNTTTGGSGTTHTGSPTTGSSGSTTSNSGITTSSSGNGSTTTGNTSNASRPAGSGASTGIIRLDFNENGVSLTNLSKTELDLSGMTFTSSAGTWDATNWQRNNQQLSMALFADANCVQVFVGTRPRQPSDCINVAAWTSTSATSTRFWQNDFTVSNNGTQIASCSVSTGSCTFDIGGTPSNSTPSVGNVRFGQLSDFAKTDLAQFCPGTQAGYSEPRLQIGQQAVSNPGGTYNIFSDASLNSTVLRTVSANDAAIFVVDGPFCSNADGASIRWWYVAHKEELAGWIGESDGQNFYLEPVTPSAARQIQVIPLQQGLANFEIVSEVITLPQGATIRAFFLPLSTQDDAAVVTFAEILGNGLGNNTVGTLEVTIPGRNAPLTTVTTIQSSTSINIQIPATKDYVFIASRRTPGNLFIIYDTTSAINGTTNDGNTLGTTGN